MIIYNECNNKNVSNLLITIHVRLIKYDLKIIKSISYNIVREKKISVSIFDSC